MYIACSWNRAAAYVSQYESGDVWCIQKGAMRHYNQTYQGEPLRGDKVFSTGRFIQGILDVGVTQQIDTNTAVREVHPRVVAGPLPLLDDLVRTLSETEHRSPLLSFLCVYVILEEGNWRLFSKVRNRVRNVDYHAHPLPKTCDFLTVSNEMSLFQYFCFIVTIFITKLNQQRVLRGLDDLSLVDSIIKIR